MVLLVLSACAQVEIKNLEVCVDLAPTGASCADTLTMNTREIPEALWNARPVPPVPGQPVKRPTSRIGRFSLSADDWAKVKTMIEQLCSATKCTDEQQKLIKGFFSRLPSNDMRVGLAPKSVSGPSE